MEDLCPICYEKNATYITECKYSYCFSCLSQIKKCAMCRKLLQKSNIYVQTNQNQNFIQSNNQSLETIRVSFNTTTSNNLTNRTRQYL